MGKITRICLIRHGETDWNAFGKLQGKTDIPLNRKGIKQAEECRQNFADTDWDVMITSPLKRAKQTAEIINSDLDLPLIEMEEFVERGYGEAEGMNLEERLSTYPDRNYPNQEEAESVRIRVKEGISKINLMYPEKRVMLVAHGGAINSILSILSNGEIGSGKTKLINACISNIHFQQEEWKIRDFNQVKHLSSYKVQEKF